VREVSDRFAANLIRIRKEADLSQEELAIMASVHRTEISLLERGVRLPRLDTLIKVAASLEVSADELLAGIEWISGQRRAGNFRATAGVEPRTDG
jgi:transcriptional regulator with XRE-family HTH domain